MQEAFHRGCLFCRTGREENVIRQLRFLIPQVRALAPKKTRYRREGGVAREETVSLLPGYVFFEAPDDALMAPVIRLEDVLRLLAYSDGDWRLHGSDDQFAGLLFGAEGSIGLSTAYFDEGDRIRVTGGFMMEYEGFITRVNRRARTAEVRIPFQDKQITMWLGYELIAPAGRD